MQYYVVIIFVKIYIYVSRIEEFARGHDFKNWINNNDFYTWRFSVNERSVLPNVYTVVLSPV